MENSEQRSRGHAVETMFQMKLLVLAMVCHRPVLHLVAKGLGPIDDALATHGLEIGLLGDGSGRRYVLPLSYH